VRADQRVGCTDRLEDAQHRLNVHLLAPTRIAGGQGAVSL
jgi:hypothetical protein